MIPYGRQDISEADIAAVVEVLESDYLTQGPAVPRFEEVVAGYVDARHAVAVNSATSALHVACLALGLGPGDVLWTSPITFVASANCALHCGARADFVDIDPKTFNLSIDALKHKLEAAERNGSLPKIVVPVHFSGLSCDMAAIRDLSEKYGFSVIEDASHAIGGRYQGAPVGNCINSRITVFSFHPVKIVTSGEGGVAVTNDEELARQMALLRSHGITRDKEFMTDEPDGDWYYQQVALGFNFRMTDMQAALGVSQMGRLDDYVSRRHELLRDYDEAMQDLPATPQYHPADCYSAAHLYAIRLRTSELTVSRAEVFAAMRDAGVGVNLHYIPVHLQPWYKSFGFGRGDFPEAEKYYSQALSLPLFPRLSNEEQLAIIENLRGILK